MLTSSPRGTEDILPDKIDRWYFVENTARQVSQLYGYKEIRTPIFEHTELFNRGVGDTTDIVEKEMYTFKDRGERSLTLRPEGTAPVVRALLEHSLASASLPIKLFYLGPMFRYGRPQAGRLRQFHQFGIEAFGSREPALDAEIIAVAMDFYTRLGIAGLELHLNSVGCPQCRQQHNRELKNYLQPYLGEICPTCQNRFERNPLRIFDCKSPICQEIVAAAPTIVTCLCEDCARHFKGVQVFLKELGISFKLNERLVRGLDYYTNTAFEIMAAGLGAQNAIGGGGRYDGLAQSLGGKPIAAVGFGLGLERILLALENQGREIPLDQGIDVLVTMATPEVETVAVRLLALLRAAGLKADRDYQGRSLRGQMKYAHRYPARLVVILGEEELSRGRVVIRHLDNGQQQDVVLEEVVTYCQQKKERGWQ